MKADLTFSQSLKKLKIIAEKLDKGDLELEEALKLYEEGILLHRKCVDRLTKAKLKFEEVSKSS